MSESLDEIINSISKPTKDCDKDHIPAVYNKYFSLQIKYTYQLIFGTLVNSKIPNPTDYYCGNLEREINRTFPKVNIDHVSFTYEDFETFSETFKNLVDHYSLKINADTEFKKPRSLEDERYYIMVSILYIPVLA